MTSLKAETLKSLATTRPTSSWEKLARMHQQTMAFLHERDPTFPNAVLDERRLRIEGGYLGRGYAQSTPAGRLAIELGAKHGMRLDPTYTAKAFAALMAEAKGNERHVLFWHTHAETPLQVDESKVDELPHELRSYAR